MTTATDMPPLLVRRPARVEEVAIGEPVATCRSCGVLCLLPSRDRPPPPVVCVGCVRRGR